MGIWSQEIFAVVCDECFVSTDEDRCDSCISELAARIDAVKAGFVERDGKWLCADCAKKGGE